MDGATRGYAVLDVETTGFTPATDRVVEIAVVHADPDGVVTDEWHTLLDPDGADVGPTHVHGIAQRDVEGAPRLAQVAAEVVGRLAGRVVVAHNAEFDLAFLRAELERAGAAVPTPVVSLCTLAASRHHLPALRWRKLAHCCAAAGVELSDAHAALGDARATAALLGHYLRTAGPVRARYEALLDAASAAAWQAPAGSSAAVRPRVLPQRPATAAVGVAEPTIELLPDQEPWPTPQPPRPDPAAPFPPVAPLSPAAAPLVPAAARPPVDTGPPLRVGDGVAFTGGDEAVRAALEAAARERGLRVTGSVSGRTVVLVTDDAASGTGKARRAAALGTRVVGTVAFATLLGDVQPA